METQTTQNRKKVTYGLAASVFAVAGVLFYVSGTPEVIAAGSIVIAVVIGWLALRSQAPLVRQQVTFGLAALVFAIAGVVLMPGFIAGVCVIVGVLLLWVALSGER